MPHGRSGAFLAPVETYLERELRRLAEERKAQREEEEQAQRQTEFRRQEEARRDFQPTGALTWEQLMAAQEQWVAAQKQAQRQTEFRRQEEARRDFQPTGGITGLTGRQALFDRGIRDYVLPVGGPLAFAPVVPPAVARQERDVAGRVAGAPFALLGFGTEVTAAWAEGVISLAQEMLTGVAPGRPPHIRTHKEQLLERAVYLHEEATGSVPNFQEFTAISEEIGGPLPPGVRGTLEVLPWLVVPGGIGTQAALRGTAAGLATRRGLLGTVGAPTLRAAAGTLEPLAFAERAAAAGVGHLARLGVRGTKAGVGATRAGLATARRGAAETLVRAPFEPVQDVGLRLAGLRRVRGGAITLGAEERGSRITKFLEPSLQARFKAVNTAVESVGYKMDALAGTRPDEYFIGLQRPRKGGFQAVSPEQFGRMSPGLDDFTRQLSPLPTGARGRLFFKTFDDVEAFLKTGEYTPASITSPVRAGPFKKVYETVKPGPATAPVAQDVGLAQEARYFAESAQLYDDAPEAVQKGLLAQAGIPEGRHGRQFMQFGDDRLKLQAVLQKGGIAEEIGAATARADLDKRILEIERKLSVQRKELEGALSQLASMEEHAPFEMSFEIAASQLTKAVRTRHTYKPARAQAQVQRGIDEALDEAGIRISYTAGGDNTIRGTREQLQALAAALRKRGHEPGAIRESVGPQIAREATSNIQGRISNLEEGLRQARSELAPTPAPAAPVRAPEPPARAPEPPPPARAAPPEPIVPEGVAELTPQQRRPLILERVRNSDREIANSGVTLDQGVEAGRILTSMEFRRGVAREAMATDDAIRAALQKGLAERDFARWMVLQRETNLTHRELMSVAEAGAMRNQAAVEYMAAAGPFRDVATPLERLTSQGLTNAEARAQLARQGGTARPEPPVAPAAKALPAPPAAAATPPVEPPLPPARPPAPPAEPARGPTVAAGREGILMPREEERATAFLREADPSPPPKPPAQPPTGGEPPGLPPGGRRPRRPRGEQPEDVLAEIERTRTLEEPVNQTLMRRHSGALNAAELEARIIVDEGSDALKRTGLGQTVRGRLAARQQDIPILDDLLEALHDPTKAPGLRPDLQPHYQKLRELTDWEEAMRIDFDPSQALVEDYFYRGWKPPEALVLARLGTPSGSLGKIPGFKMPRANATYRQMREAGFEPLFWNPYEQWRASRLMGVRYREQITLIDKMKKTGLAHPSTGAAAPEGWRTPRVGPAFEGKPVGIVDKNGVSRSLRTRRWVVPDDLANTLENMYGTPLGFGKIHPFGRTIDLMKAVDAVTFLPKRAKLFASLFQQQDFLTRSGIGAWTGMVDNLLAGRPIAAVRSLAIWPKSAYTIIQANLGPGARANLRRTLNSTDPILPDRPGVHFRGITESGLSTIDVTILPGNIDVVAREVATASGLLGVKKVARLVGDMESAMRRGLFEGVYPAAQVTDIRNTIAPMVARQWPKLADDQINGIIARVANIKYSTIPASQSVFQNRVAREFLRRVFFSIGESEGLLRQAAGAIRGPYAAIWRRHWIATFISLLATASAIHYASTGKGLPAERWSPVAKTPFGLIPYGYNRDFAAPTLPISGRGGAELTLDIVGQMDTALRLLNPISFVDSRFSVPLRAVASQVAGETFFGERLDVGGLEEVYRRTFQLINDMLVPIGPGGAGIEVIRALVPALREVIPEQEPRLGLAGQAVQATGANVRAETTRQLLRRIARESGFRTPDGKLIEEWEEMSPAQKRQKEQEEPLKSELASRQKTAVDRGSESARARAELDKVTDRRLVKENALVKELEAEKITKEQFRSRYGGIQGEAAAERAALDEAFQIFQDTEELSENPFDRAVVEYYRVWEQGRSESGIIDFDFVEEHLARLESGWTDAQKTYVEENTGITEHPPLIQEFRRASKFLRERYWVTAESERVVGTLSEEKKALWERYQASGEDLKSRIAQSNPWIKIVDKWNTREREWLRRSNKKINDVLVEWWETKDIYDGSSIERLRRGYRNRRGKEEADVGRAKVQPEVETLTVETPGGLSPSMARLEAAADAGWVEQEAVGAGSTARASTSGASTVETPGGLSPSMARLEAAADADWVE
jgi:hypothetical protein